MISRACRWVGVGVCVGLGLAVCGGPPVSAERLAIRTFTAADGLPRDQVRALLADSRGFLWLGTQEGLARFDGVQFTLFGPAEGLANPAVYDLLEDRAGRYWIATGGGVYRFTPNPREFLRMPGPGAIAANAAGAARGVSVLVEDRDGVIWCGTSEGLMRVRPTASRDGLAFASVGRGRDTADIVLEEVPLSLDPTEHGRVVGALLEARDGTLWIGTRQRIVPPRPRWTRRSIHARRRAAGERSVGAGAGCRRSPVGRHALRPRAARRQWLAWQLAQ